MTITFIVMCLDLLCRYSGILSHWCNIISVTCIKESLSALITQLTENVTGTLAFGCKRVWSNLTLLKRYCNVSRWFRKVWFDSTISKPYLDVSPSSHVYVKQTFSQWCNVKYINCRVNLNKRLKKKVLGNIITEQSLKGLCRFHCKISPRYNVQERFWNFCYHVVASYFSWPFCNLSLIYFLILFILPIIEHQSKLFLSD